MELRPGERIDLISRSGLKIIQSREVFSFSLDAVLLAHFANIPKKGNVIDLCSGTGVIPFLVSQRTEGHIVGVEIQERLWDMAERSRMMNKLEKVSFVLGDIKEMPAIFGDGRFDYLTCNPPYIPKGTADQNINPHLAIARHEVTATLEDVVQVSGRLVRSGGRVAYVFRSSRLVDLLTYMRAYKIEPKRLRFVHSKVGKEANLVLVEGIRDGGKELKVLPPLYVYDENGEYSEEMKKIYDGNPEAMSDIPS